jgi:hypothetical protein
MLDKNTKNIINFFTKNVAWAVMVGLSVILFVVGLFMPEYTAKFNLMVCIPFIILSFYEMVQIRSLKKRGFLWLFNNKKGEHLNLRLVDASANISVFSFLLIPIWVVFLIQHNEVKADLTFIAYIALFSIVYYTNTKIVEWNYDYIRKTIMDDVWNERELVFEGTMEYVQTKTRMYFSYVNELQSIAMEMLEEETDEKEREKLENDIRHLDEVKAKIVKNMQ